MKKWLLVATLMAVLAVAPAHATSLIYNNGLPNQASGNEATQWIQAEDFSLATATILTDVRFWAFEFPGAAGYQGSVTWRIYGDAGTAPDGVLFSGVVTPTRTPATPNQYGPSYQYDFSVGALALAPGTYWLGLHNGPLTTMSRMEWYWETTAANLTLTGREDSTPFDVGGWLDNQQEHAYQLYGDPVPEPASLLLLGTGLAGLVRVARRRRQ